MLKKKEIKKVFEILGLLKENERQRMLFQDKLRPQIEEKPTYQIVLDSVTTSSKKEELKSARLE